MRGFPIVPRSDGEFKANSSLRFMKDSGLSTKENQKKFFGQYKRLAVPRSRSYDLVSDIRRI